MLQGLAGGPAAETTDVTEPVLHCFHRSAGAYGHFVLDGLVTLERAREAILAGRVKSSCRGTCRSGQARR